MNKERLDRMLKEAERVYVFDYTTIYLGKGNPLAADESHKIYRIGKRDPYCWKNEDPVHFGDITDFGHEVWSVLSGEQSTYMLGRWRNLYDLEECAYRCVLPETAEERKALLDHLEEEKYSYEFLSNREKLNESVKPIYIDMYDKQIGEKRVWQEQEDTSFHSFMKNEPLWDKTMKTKGLIPEDRSLTISEGNHTALFLYIRNGAFEFESAVYGDYDSEMHYCFSRRQTNLILELMPLEEFIDRCKTDNDYFEELSIIYDGRLKPIRFCV